MHTTSRNACLISLERNDLRCQRQTQFIQFATGCRDLHKDADAPGKVIVQPVVKRECREKFETDDDSFDTAVHGWKSMLKTKGIVYRGFGILIALSQDRAAPMQQERQI